MIASSGHFRLIKAPHGLDRVLRDLVPFLEGMLRLRFYALKLLEHIGRQFALDEGQLRLAHMVFGGARLR